MRIFSTVIAVILIMIYSENRCYAQDVSVPDSKVPQVFSPETAKIGQFGSYNVNKHTGSPSINIPLYSISEAGVTIPVGLNYDASGLMPNKGSGTTGQGWTLSAGGAITRHINGEPDEKLNTNPDATEQLNHSDKGYIYGFSTIGSSWAAEEIRKMKYNTATPVPGYLNYNTALNIPTSDLPFEYEPDMFTFNFLGYSGKFFMDNAGQIQVVSDRRFSVDMSDFKPHWDLCNDMGLLGLSSNFNSNVFSRIKMTADDGTIFTFGGAVNTLEMSFTFAGATDKGVVSSSGRINAWYLTKVETTDGNVIEFKYKTYDDKEVHVLQTLCSNQPRSGANYSDVNFIDVKLSLSDEFKRYTSGSTLYDIFPGVNYNVPKKSLTKLVYLNSIVSKNQSVDFVYSTKDDAKPFYVVVDKNSFIDANSNYKTAQLDKILIEDRTKLSPSTPESWLVHPVNATKSIYFNYSYVGSDGSGYRMFLTGLNFNGVNGIEPFGYSFEYNGMNSSLPNPVTRSIDLWGFYNGKTNSYLTGLPTSLSGNTPDYSIDFSAWGIDRSADPTYSIASVLKKITYPTGGTTEFQFEGHEYSKKLKRTLSSSTAIAPTWQNTSGNETTGGLRIKKIINSPGTTTEYFYLKDFQTGHTGNVSSGLLSEDNIYYYVAQAPSANPMLFEATSDNLVAPTSYSESPIEYSEVQEKSSDGYVIDYYSTHETNPDIYYLGDNNYKTYDVTGTDITNATGGTHFNDQLKRMYRYSSTEDERGLLLKQEIYDKNNILVRKTENVYNDDINRHLVRGISFSRAKNYSYFGYKWWLYQTYANYYYTNKLTKSTVTEIDPINSTSLVTTSEYKYVSMTNPLLLEKKITQSDGAVYKTTYKYPEDFSSNAIAQDLVTKFRVGAVLEQTEWRDGQELRTNYFDYQYFNSGTLLKPFRVRVKDFLSGKPDFETFRFYTYDAAGNITEAGKANDSHSSFKWDYNSVYPVAEITNAEPGDVGYTSFETTTKDGWNYAQTQVLKDVAAPTGQSVFDITANTITRTINNSKIYTASLWNKGGTVNLNGLTPELTRTVGNWTYNQYKITSAASITISGTGYIDELRIYPRNALIKTYTYLPVYGISSECDANNNILYYEYDGHGRLSHVRDEYFNIRKKICYNYFGQPVDCSSTSPANWSPTAVTRCQVCPANSAYNTGHREHEEEDINPLSSTYQQYRWIDDGPDASCIVSPDWQNTTTPVRCKVDLDNNNTGYQEQEQMDVNPCSPTYGQTQWAVSGYDATSCPLPACTTVSCNSQGPQFKCVNGVCEQGNIVYLSSLRVRVKEDNVFVYKWFCTWVYCWSDNTSSDPIEDEGYGPCTVGTCP